MSRRARSARRLASILKQESGASWVELQYHPEHGRGWYCVRWEGGPSTDKMRRLAIAHADEIPDIPVGSLVWLRTEPCSSPYARRS